MHSVAVTVPHPDRWGTCRMDLARSHRSCAQPTTVSTTPGQGRWKRSPTAAILSTGHVWARTESLHCIMLLDGTERLPIQRGMLPNSGRRLVLSEGVCYACSRAGAPASRADSVFFARDKTSILVVNSQLDRL